MLSDGFLRDDYSLLRASRAGLLDFENPRDPPSSSSASRLSEYKRPSQLRYGYVLATGRMGRPDTHCRLLTRGISSQLTELQRENEKLRTRIDKLQCMKSR